MRHYIDVVLVDDGSTLPEAQAYLKVRWCNLGTRVTRVTLNPKPKTQNPTPQRTRVAIIMTIQTLTDTGRLQGARVDSI